MKNFEKVLCYVLMVSMLALLAISVFSTSTLVAIFFGAMMISGLTLCMFQDKSDIIKRAYEQYNIVDLG